MKGKAFINHNAEDALSISSFAGLDNDTAHNRDGSGSETTKNTSGSSGNRGNSSSGGIARRETSLVNGSKILVYMFILLAAAGAGVGTYHFMEQVRLNFLDQENGVRKYVPLSAITQAMTRSIF